MAKLSGVLLISSGYGTTPCLDGRPPGNTRDFGAGHHGIMTVLMFGCHTSYRRSSEKRISSSGKASSSEIKRQFSWKCAAMLRIRGDIGIPVLEDCPDYVVKYPVSLCTANFHCLSQRCIFHMYYFHIFSQDVLSNFYSSSVSCVTNSFMNSMYFIIVLGTISWNICYCKVPLEC